MPFSLPIIDVEQKQVEDKPKLCNNKLLFLLPIIDVVQKQVEEKLKLCKQNYATIICHFRF
jgi:hypothetical protein